MSLLESRDEGGSFYRLAWFATRLPAELLQNHGILNLLIAGQQQHLGNDFGGARVVVGEGKKKPAAVLSCSGRKVKTAEDAEGAESSALSAFSAVTKARRNFPTQRKSK